MLWRVRRAGAAYISRNRRSSAIRVLHRVARYVEDAYENTNLDMSTNGEANVLRRLAPAGFRTVFDVGAHVGEWTLAALNVWADAHVHAFEVMPQTFNGLVEATRRTGTDGRVTLNPFGLSDTGGVAEMFYFPGHADLTCDRPRHEGRQCITFDAQLRSGDDYVTEHGLDEIDYLKIDVEGAEYKVLHGLSNSMAAGKIQCIQFEYGAFSTQTRVLLADYYALLASRYWVGKIFPSSVEFADYSWRVEDFRFANFLAVSRHRPDLKKRLS